MMLNTSISDRRSVVDKKVCALGSSHLGLLEPIGPALPLLSVTHPIVPAFVLLSQFLLFGFRLPIGPLALHSIPISSAIIISPLSSFFFSPSPVPQVVRADPETLPMIQPYSHVAEGINGGGFRMAAECRVPTQKLMEGRWIRCDFLVMED